MIALLASCTAPSTLDEESLFEEDESFTELESVQLTAQERELFDLVNEYRMSQGLDSVTYSGQTYSFAEKHNRYMISKGELSHDNFTARASGISKKTAANFVAENVAKNYEESTRTLEAWLASTPHRNTIEGDFTHATLSITLDEKGKPYYTQIFFRR